MSRIKFDMGLMRFISLFESITNVSVKDCLETSEALMFIVPPEMASRAVGWKGKNVQRIEKALNRKLKIVEYNSDLKQFVQNLIHPLKAKEVNDNDGEVVIVPYDFKTRGYLIGRQGSKLREFEMLIKRHFPIKILKVV